MLHDLQTHKQTNNQTIQAMVLPSIVLQPLHTLPDNRHTKKQPNEQSNSQTNKQMETSPLIVVQWNAVIIDAA